MLHINTIPLIKDGNHIDYWAKFELTDEHIECQFIHDGEVFHVVNNIKYPYGVVGMIAHILCNKNAEVEVLRIIESSNKSKHSKLKGLNVLHGEYHDR